MHCLSQNLQSHSLAVGHKKRCNETSFHKICNVTHSLLGIGKDVMLSFTKWMSQTGCWSYDKMWRDYLSQIVQCHLQTVGHSKRCDQNHETAFYKMWNVTYILVVMWWDCLSQVVQCHSLAISHRKRGDETAFHKMWNVTHSLLVIGKDGIRLPFTKCAMSLTRCWS